MSNVWEGEVPSVVAANVKIKLSANAAPLISITGSFEEDRWAQWVQPITPMLVVKLQMHESYPYMETLPQLSKVQQIIIKKVAEE